MNDIITISGIRGFIDENGVAQLNAEDVARGWGFTQKKNSVKYVRWETINGYLHEFGFSQQVGKDDFIPENMVYRLGFKASNEAAQKFQILLADEVLPALRKTGTYSTKPMTQLEIIAANAAALVEQERKMKELEARQDAHDQQLQGIREIVALNPNDWRKDTARLINKIAVSMGGYEHVKPVRAESYKLLDERMGVDLNCRLTNKRRRMADEGVCKSKRDKTNQLDVIADDKKLIEGYIAIVKEMAIKYGLAA